MAGQYFDRVESQTPTRFWVNNPTLAEAEKAIAAGARNVTTNPAFCSKLIKSEPDYLRQIIDGVVKEASDDDVAADLVYQRAASRIMDMFLDIYHQSGGTDGYVTIQADPREDEDADAMVNAAIRHGRLGKNYMAKIPVTPAGAQAIETLVERDVPICATEVFSIAQALHICDLYKRASEKSGKHPVFYVTHITGIYDEYLQRLVKRDGIDISPDVLRHAGCAVARKEYRLLKERGYEARLLGGGARGTHHFTEFVGGDMHITINWSTAQELIEADGPVDLRMNTETPKHIIEELEAKLPDFRRAYREDGLAVEEFAEFGPVQLFRNNFIEGYYRLLAEIPARRASLLL